MQPGAWVTEAQEARQTVSLRASPGAASVGGSADSLLRLRSLPGSSPGKGPRSGTGAARGQTTSPILEEPGVVTGARSPKACLWGCQGPVCAHLHPGGYRPSSPGGAAGRRMPVVPLEVEVYFPNCG